MRVIGLVNIFFWLVGGAMAGEGIAFVPEPVKVTLPTNEWIQRADLYLVRTCPVPKGWLLLCPGRNGSGESWVRDARWQAFAQERGLLMCGLSFASSRKDDLLGRYTLVDQGSGEAVLEQCRGFAGGELPFVVFGFSAGARFTANFQAWKPDLVAAWCAQAVGNWPEQRSALLAPPGIVASGEYDAGAWFSSLQYFQAGRKLGKPLVWLSLEKVAHKRSPLLEDFAREFFATALEAREAKRSLGPEVGEWFDIDSRKPVAAEAVKNDPIFATWLPTKKLAEKWQDVHHP